MPVHVFSGYGRRLGDKNGEDPPAGQPDPIPAYHDQLIVLGDEVDEAAAAATLQGPENMKIVAASWLVGDGIQLSDQVAVKVEQLLLDMTLLGTSSQEIMLTGTQYMSYQWQQCREEVSRFKSLSSSSSSASAPIGIAATSSSSLAPIGIAAPSGSSLTPIDDAAPLESLFDLTPEEMEMMGGEIFDSGSNPAEANGGKRTRDKKEKKDKGGDGGKNKKKKLALDPKDKKA